MPEIGTIVEMSYGLEFSLAQWKCTVVLKLPHFIALAPCVFRPLFSFPKIILMHLHACMYL